MDDGIAEIRLNDAQATISGLSPGVEYWINVMAVGSSADNVGRESPRLKITTGEFCQLSTSSNDQ